MNVKDVFFEEINQLVSNGEDIYIVSADLGAKSFDSFREQFPERYISVGIAEQNLIEVSCGLSLDGKKVIAYGLNPFPITRAYDQIRCLLADKSIPITLCCLNMGLCSAEAGYTHMPIENFAITRTLKNVISYYPSDFTISTILAKNTLCCSFPRIISFDKAIDEAIYNDIDLSLGFALNKYDINSKICVITQGVYVNEIAKAFCKKNVTSVDLIDIFSTKIELTRCVDILNHYKKIITIEENVYSAGLGSFVLELLSDNNVNIPVKRIGIDLTNGYYTVFTNREYIRKDQGLDIENIIEIILEQANETQF